MTARRFAALFVAACVGGALACATSRSADSAAALRADPAIVSFIATIKAVDNHTHANSVAPGDTDADALPLDGVAPFEIPATLRPDNPDWLAAYQALYKYPHPDLSDAHLKELRETMKGVGRAEGDKFPAWVLDRVGTEVLLANRDRDGTGARAAARALGVLRGRADAAAVHEGRRRRVARPREAVSARGGAPAALPVRSPRSRACRPRSTPTSRPSSRPRSRRSGPAAAWR